MDAVGRHPEAGAMYVNVAATGRDHRIGGARGRTHGRFRRNVNKGSKNVPAAARKFQR